MLQQLLNCIFCWHLVQLKAPVSWFTDWVLTVEHLLGRRDDHRVLLWAEDLCEVSGHWVFIRWNVKLHKERNGWMVSVCCRGIILLLIIIIIPVLNLSWSEAGLKKRKKVRCSLVCLKGLLCVRVGRSVYLAVVRRGGAAVFGWNLNLVGHDAPAVQHLGAGPLQLLQDLGQLGVVVARRAPAQHSGQIVAGAEGQHPQLALKGSRHRGLLGSAVTLLGCVWSCMLRLYDCALWKLASRKDKPSAGCPQWEVPKNPTWLQVRGRKQSEVALLHSAFLFST